MRQLSEKENRRLRQQASRRKREAENEDRDARIAAWLFGGICALLFVIIGLIVLYGPQESAGPKQTVSQHK